MSRRSKLDLSAGKDHAKQQAPGFEMVSEDVSETSAAAADEQSEPITPERITLESPGYTKDEPLSEEQEKPISDRAGWPNGKQLGRAVIVVAVAALALYLLKRRFF